MKKMNDELPQEVMNCFLVAGYDTAKCISEMSDNSIAEIEKYIDSVKDHYPNCLRCDSSGKPILPPTIPFQFPPGHRDQIKQFISSVKKLFAKPCTSKCESTDPTNPPLSKKKKSTNSLHEEVPAVTNEVQLIIRHWAKSHDDDKCCIQEGRDYTIQVSKSTINADVCNASIMCRCNRSYKVTTKPNGKRSISNWTNHFKKCNKRNNPTSKQNKLQSYFTESSTMASPSSSHSLCNDLYTIPVCVAPTGNPPLQLAAVSDYNTLSLHDNQASLTLTPSQSSALSLCHRDSQLPIFPVNVTQYNNLQLHEPNVNDESPLHDQASLSEQLELPTLPEIPIIPVPTSCVNLKLHASSHPINLHLHYKTQRRIRFFSEPLL